MAIQEGVMTEKGEQPHGTKGEAVPNANDPGESAPSPDGVTPSVARLRALLDQTTRQEKYYEETQQRYRALAIRWRLSIGAFSAITTVLLGVTAPAIEVVLKNVAMGASALVTFVSMIEAYRDDRSNYVRMAATFKAFRRLRFEIEDLLASPKQRPEEVERLKSEFAAIQLAHDTGWVESRQRQTATRQGSGVGP
jgi:uncharacterized membrane protein